MTHRKPPPPWAFWGPRARRRYYEARALFRWHVLRECPECRMLRERSPYHGGYMHKMDCSAWHGRYR